MRQPPPTKLLAGNSLPLALGGSALLHLGVLFAVPATVPAAPRAAHVLEARLAPAAPAPAPQPAAAAESQPRQPATTSPRPHQAAQPQRIVMAQTVQPVPQAAPAALPSATNATNSAPAPEPPATSVATASEPAISSTTYYEGDQLDTPPQLLGEVQQIYPRRARTEEIEGVVTLSLLIDETGRVDEVDVINARPAGYFEQAARDMLRQQRFTPALIHNRPVKSRWRTTVRYRLQS